ncbi:MAG: OadG family protein [Thiolinea sp.]
MQSALIEQGLSLMLYGMGVVFTFLTLLIFATTGMSRVVQRWFPDKVEPVAPTRKKSAATGTVSPLTLKIIQAAIEQHRSR